MLVRFLARSKLANDVPPLSLTSQHVLVNDKALQSDGTARVYAPSADADLGPETISEAIREACASVDECACRINATREHGRGEVVFSHDGVGVMRGVRVDELDRLVHGRHCLHGYGKVEVLGGVRRLVRL